MDEGNDKIEAATEAGYPVVAHTDICPHWAGQMESSLCPIRECWYCRWADFRKDLDSSLEHSPCRCPENRVAPYPATKMRG